MDSPGLSLLAPPTTDRLLQVYLLGCVPFERVLALQRRLVQRVEADRQQAALIVCEHPPLITVGRLGSRAHIHYERDELEIREWKVRWINRGGGCLLHLPGQLAIYPIVALDQRGWNVCDHVQWLGSVAVELLRDYGIGCTVDTATGNVWVQRRSIGVVGVSVRHWVAYHGLFVNVGPNLEWMRRVRTSPDALAMTSLERERHGPVAMSRVRERVIELVAGQLGMEQKAVFFEHG